ncbi:IclR family transcriptional regulator [Glutamicibacter sp. NPDC127525]|uniref:IclR family transcriptional regulator n=1 Tax=unclassified Glutamicibacter TaxID=2627139 RepID=UPI00363AE9A9
MSNHVTSVGNALALLQILQDRKNIRVIDAAQELGVARSTAHRLLSTLKEFGFAVQDGEKSYALSPWWRGGKQSVTAETALPMARPHLKWLMERTEETIHFMQPEGRMVQIIETIECEHGLRVGNRVGSLFPAHIVAAGRLFLGRMTIEELKLMYPAGPPEDSGVIAMEDFYASFQSQRPYAVTYGRGERGVNAVAMLVDDPDRRGIAAVSLSGPSFRMLPQTIAQMTDLLQECVQRINASIRQQRR